MSAESACLAVIPARGGSKRIPGKNLGCLEGKPLLAYTVEAALQSDLFERVIVTTDSPDIADVARECGADVPFLRDASLSDDFVPVSAATVDALERIDPSRTTCSPTCASSCRTVRCGLPATSSPATSSSSAPEPRHKSPWSATDGRTPGGPCGATSISSSRRCSRM